MEIIKLEGQVTLQAEVDKESEVAGAIRELVEEAEIRELLIWGVWSEPRFEGFAVKLFGGVLRL